MDYRVIKSTPLDYRVVDFDKRDKTVQYLSDLIPATAVEAMERTAPRVVLNFLASRFYTTHLEVDGQKVPFPTGMKQPKFLHGSRYCTDFNPSERISIVYATGYLLLNDFLLNTVVNRDGHAVALVKKYYDKGDSRVDVRYDVEPPTDNYNGFFYFSFDCVTPKDLSTRGLKEGFNVAMDYSDGQRIKTRVDIRFFSTQNSDQEQTVSCLFEGDTFSQAMIHSKVPAKMSKFAPEVVALGPYSREKSVHWYDAGTAEAEMLATAILGEGVGNRKLDVRALVEEMRSTTARGLLLRPGDLTVFLT